MGRQKSQVHGASMALQAHVLLLESPPITSLSPEAIPLQLWQGSEVDSGPCTDRAMVSPSCLAASAGCPGLPPPLSWEPLGPEPPRPGLHLGCQAPARWEWVSEGCWLVSRPRLFSRVSPQGFLLEGRCCPPGPLPCASSSLSCPSWAPAPSGSRDSARWGCRCNTGDGPQKRGSVPAGWHRARV